MVKPRSAAEQADALHDATAPLPKTNGVAAVVAPYGPGAHYSGEFQRLGWRCIAVTPPEADLPPVYRGTLDPSRYHHTVIHHADSPRRTATILAALGVTAVVAGTHIGVPDADLLADLLHLPGNAPATSQRRRDKGAMAKALQQAGLAAPRSLTTDDLDAALTWASHQHGINAYVIKPVDSTGSDGFHFCHNSAALREAWGALHHKPTALGGRNERLIVQECLRGWQYVVNTVSTRAGSLTRHQVTDVWADSRTGTQRLYDRQDLLDPHHLLPQALAEYTMHALDALGIKVGPAHTEIMYTTDRGPVIIETGAWPEGTNDPAAMRLATAGRNHLSDTVEALTTGTFTAPPLRPERTHITKVSLIAPHDGLLDEEHLHALFTLRNLAGTTGNLTPHAPVQRTQDLHTSPGQLTLVSENAHSINVDYHAIRAAEASGLYTPATNPRTPTSTARDAALQREDPGPSHVRP